MSLMVPGKKSAFLLAAIVLSALSVITYAQVPHSDKALPSFEVAKINMNGNNSHVAILPPGAAQVFRTIAPARALIGQAYVEQVFGGPEWIDKDIFAIEGKIPDTDFVEMQKMNFNDRRIKVNLMLQSLLEQRFKLKVHFEKREMQVFALTSKGDLKLNKNKDNDPSPSMLGGSYGNGVARIMAINITLGDFASRLKGLAVDRPVIDHTGIEGKFTFTLRVAPDGPVFANLPRPSADATVESPPSFFTALEDLGLKLQPSKEPVEVVVIDSIELPSEN